MAQRWIPVFTLALSGCAFPQALQRVAVDQNVVVARTTDTVALLNILRAREGYPLHFTSFSRLSGNVAFSASAGANTSIGLDRNSGSDSVGAQTGTGVATNPSFDVTIHDTQDFQRGILQPIDPKVINFYLREGWRPDLLTYLLVQRVDFTVAERVEVPGQAGAPPIVFKAGDRLAAIDNHPDEPGDAERFAAFVGCYTLAPASVSGTETPLLPMKDTGTPGIAGVALLDGSRLDLGQGPSGGARDWIVRKSAAGETVTLARAPGAATSCGDQIAVVGDSAESVSGGGGRSLFRLESLAPRDPLHALRLRDGAVASALVTVNANGRPVTVKASVDVTFRSVEGVIYFLGEYSRVPRERPWKPAFTIVSHGEAEPLLLILPGRGARYDLSAELNGAAFHVPAHGAGKSYSVITLVEQLFNLQKSASSQPQSTAVRVVN